MLHRATGCALHEGLAGRLSKEAMRDRRRSAEFVELGAPPSVYPLCRKYEKGPPPMAYFASVRLPTGPVYINLDYVLRVDVGADANDSTAVRMTNGEIVKLPPEEGQRLIQQLDACNRRE